MFWKMSKGTENLLLITIAQTTAAVLGLSPKPEFLLYFLPGGSTISRLLAVILKALPRESVKAEQA